MCHIKTDSFKIVHFQDIILNNTSREQTNENRHGHEMSQNSKHASKNSKNREKCGEKSSFEKLIEEG